MTKRILFFAVVALTLFACSGSDDHQESITLSSSSDAPSSSSGDDTPSSSSDTPSSSSSDNTPSSSSAGTPPPPPPPSSSSSSSVEARQIAAKNLTFDDIQYWAGEGENRAILIVQWNDGKSPEALAWGYRWSGTKYGIDIINDIVKADGRLFAITDYTGPGLGDAIAGFGFDYSGNHNAKLSNGRVPCQSPIDGKLIATGYDYDDWYLCEGNDASARFAAGWYSKGYWSYWISDAIGSQWKYSGLGASSRILENNSIDAWYFDINAFTDDENSTFYRCMGSGKDCDGRNYFGNITPISKPR